MSYPSEPRVHGNGFLQVDLDADRRLHVWDHRIPRQRTDSSIHDHGFRFESDVLEGTIINVTFTPRWGSNGRGRWGKATHNIYVAEPGDGEETALVRAGRRVHLEANVPLLVLPGDRYRMGSVTFHASLHLGTTVTLMRKFDRMAGYAPRVAVRIGQRPDNAWRRDGAAVPDEVRRKADEWIRKLT